MPFSSADAIIAGAGIIGASIAWRLAQSGLRVAMLDAGLVGNEASWAGAGMLAPGGEMERRGFWSDFALESLRLYESFVRELESESGCRIDYQRCGAIEIARTPEEWTTLQVRAKMQHSAGISSTPLEITEVRERIPLLGIEPAGALFYPDDAIVDPRDIMRALRIACCSRGVVIHERQRVTAIRAAAGCVEAITAGGTISAANAVLAAGAWSREIEISVEGKPHALISTFPVKGHLAGYRLAPGSLPAVLRCGQTYLLQRSSGFTIAGSSLERVGYDRTVNPEVVADICERASTLLPHLRSTSPPEAWIGFRPATEKLEPEIGRVPGAPVWLAYGHYRNGILLAPATARWISSEISGGK
jgi:glycine oxidase